MSHNSIPISDTQLSGKFAGFRKASGRAVHVSEQAMCRAQKLITEELGGGNPTKEESVTTPLSMKQIAAPYTTVISLNATVLCPLQEGFGVERYMQILQLAWEDFIPWVSGCVPASD